MTVQVKNKIKNYWCPGQKSIDYLWFLNLNFQNKNLKPLHFFSVVSKIPPSSVLLPPSHIQNPAASKSVVPTPAQCTAWAERKSQFQTELNNAVDKWTKSTLNTTSELACRFDKKEWYFLNIFFQGGAHLFCKQTKVNAYNTFKHLKAEGLHNGEMFLWCGCSTYLIQLPLPDGKRPTLSKLEEFKAEYEALDDEELEEMVANHSEHVSGSLTRCYSTQAHVQDVTSTIMTMQKIVSPTPRWIPLCWCACFEYDRL